MKRDGIDPEKNDKDINIAKLKGTDQVKGWLKSARINRDFSIDTGTFFYQAVKRFW